MMFKKSFLFGLLVLTYSYTFAQSDQLKKLINQGRLQHTKGNFTKAITYFQKALNINNQSPIANYELANSHYANKEFETARQFSQKVIDNKKEYLLAAYLLNGSCLTDMGKLIEANKVFEEAAQKYTHHYLLFYNLGINYYGLKKYNKALKFAQRAVFLKPLHASSHLLLAALNEIQGNQVKSALSYYFFLLLEPGSVRSLKALQELKNLLNLMTNNEGGLSASKDPFLMTKYLLSKVDMSRKKGNSEIKSFTDKTKFFFRTIGNIHRKTPFPSVWGSTYTRLFYKLGKSRHLTPFCYFIHQIAPSEEIKAWNEQKRNIKATTSFQYWMGKQLSIF